MADEKYDPTDESDASAARDDVTSDDREPIGREFLEHGPEHVDSLGDPDDDRDVDDESDGFDPEDYESDELARAEAEVAEDDGDGVIDDEEAALAATRSSRRPVRRSADTGTEVATTRRGSSRKGRATPRQKQRSGEHHRTTPAQFVGESVGELRKVVWPTGEQLRGYFAVVLVFVLFIIAFVSLLDLAYGWALLKVFG